MSSNKMFRSWYKHDNPPILFFQETKEGLSCELVSENYPDIRYSIEVAFCDDNWILEQYTGLNDECGQYIFEGDILEINEYIAKVVFVDSGYVLKSLDGKDIPIDLFNPHFNEGLSRLYVIGNTHKGVIKND